MLNSRCSVRRRLYEGHKEDVLVYGMPDMLGLPDFSYFDAANEQDWARVASLLEMTICAIEPRIQSLKVAVQGFDVKKQELQVQVSGSIQSGSITQDIRFPLTLTQGDYQGATSKVA